VVDELREEEGKEHFKGKKVKYPLMEHGSELHKAKTQGTQR